MNMRLAKTLKVLEYSEFLKAQLLIENSNNLKNIELLSNGKKFMENFIKHWRLNETTETKVDFKKLNESIHDDTEKPLRYNFVKNLNFLNDLKEVQRYPTIIKTQCLEKDVNISGKLITDYFVHSASGLEKYYNIQRERKIWWMRYSANPSRYFLKPYENDGPIEMVNAQSVTIKARFPFGNMDVENIILVQLNEIQSKNYTTADTPMLNNNNDNSEQLLPSVIRSVIDIKHAVSVLLFDAHDDHRRDHALLLNPKLAPYQCTLACLHQDDTLADLKDLYTHLSKVIERSGLRFLTGSHCAEMFSNNYKQIENIYQKVDSLGIPYTLLIDSKTLENGILKLRSRDTTLEETIHITDIPKYLLQIFQK